MKGLLVLVLFAATVVAETSARPRTAFLVIDVQNDFLPGGSLEVKNSDEVVPAINRIRSAHKDAFDLVVVTQDWHSLHHASFASTYPGHQAFDAIEIQYNKKGEACKGDWRVRPEASFFVKCKPEEVEQTLHQVLWPDHCVAGTHGAELHYALDRSPSDIVVRKGYDARVDSYSAFFSLGKITETELAGVLRERGVERVVVAGIARDFCVFFTAMDARSLGLQVVFVWDATRAVSDDSTGEILAKLAKAGVTVVNEADLPDVL